MNNNIKEYTYSQHLGDNEELLRAIKEAAMREKGQTLICAPCSSGKTYTMLVQVAREWEFNDRNLVLAVPTVVQAWQCQNYSASGHPVEIRTGDNGQIENCFAITATTYDKVHQLMNWPALFLSVTTLIIDEAHMLVTEKNYRSKAIADVFDAARLVLRKGGSVIYLTATPRRIMFRQFFETIGTAENASIIKAVQADEKGNRLPKIKPRKITVLRAPEKKNIFSCTMELARRNKENGKRTFMLYNSKRQIDKMMETLREEGISACRLTADDKGFYFEDICDEEGFVRDSQKVYLSETYGSIVEHETLPDYDVYCCTSVIEAGTNIKGIRIGNEVIQPENLAAMFVAKNYTEFDLDKIEQFFSRIRFATDEAQILLGTPDKKEIRETVNFDVEGWCEEAGRELLRRKYFDSAVDNLRTIDGSRQIRLTSTGDDGNATADNIRIVDEAWKQYDNQVFFAAGLTAQCIEKRMLVPTETMAFEDVMAQDTAPVELAEETRLALVEMLSDSKTFRSMRERTSPDMSNELVRTLVTKENGNRVMRETQRLANLSQTMTPEVLPHVVAERIAGNRVYVDENGMIADRATSGSMDIMEYAEKREFAYLGRKLSNAVLGDIISYYRREQGCRTLNDITNDQPIKNTIRYLLDTKRFHTISDMDGHGLFKNSYGKLFAIAGYYKQAELEMLAKACNYIYLNGFADGSREIKALLAACTKAMAEYLVLRYPEKYLVSDKGKKVWTKSGMCSVITADDMSLIAEHMEASVKRLCKNYNRATSYSRDMIYSHLCAMYKCTAMTKERESNKCPEKIRVKGLRVKLPHLAIDG